jgi:hypothetical protein
MMSVGHRVLLLSVSTLLLMGMSGAVSTRALSQNSTTIQISFKNNKFQPNEIRGPANVPITLIVKNIDPTPMEFESVSLRVEKIVTGNTEGIIRLRPLSPGRYSFFDDFHPDALGVLIIQ